MSKRADGHPYTYVVKHNDTVFGYANNLVDAKKLYKYASQGGEVSLLRYNNNEYFPSSKVIHVV